MEIRNAGRQLCGVAGKLAGATNLKSNVALTYENVIRPMTDPDRGVDIGTL